MNKLTLRLFVLCLLTSTGSFAQKGLVNPNVDIHLMPVALAFPDPSVRIGSEYMTGGRWSYGLSLGAGVNALSFGSVRSSEKPKRYSMVEIRPEVKFYWLQREYMGWYVAAEGLVSVSNRKLGKDAHYLSDSTQVSFDGSDFSKNKVGLVGKVGVKFLIPKKFTIDMYTGLGLARTNVRYTAIENPKEGYYDPFFEWENFYPGRKFTPIISFGVKFGMLVWQR